MAENLSHVLTTAPAMSITDDDVVLALATTNMVVEDDRRQTYSSETTSAGTVLRRRPARRGKIKMEKMEKDNNLLVTFSKRKSGLMKKVNELCTMCGVQCALVIFSPAGKVFSFGHPSVHQVADRYLSASPNLIFGIQNEAGGVDDAVLSTEDLIAELRTLEAALEAAKKHGKVLEDKRAMRMRSSCWWERPLQELNGGQRETLKRAMVDLKSQVFEMDKLRLMPPPGFRSSTHSPLSLGLGSLTEPNFHGAATSLSFGGFPTWNRNNYEPANNNEAGPSGHASGGSLCGAI